jgi:hypothetical protein
LNHNYSFEIENTKNSKYMEHKQTTVRHTIKENWGKCNFIIPCCYRQRLNNFEYELFHSKTIFLGISFVPEEGFDAKTETKTSTVLLNSMLVPKLALYHSKICSGCSVPEGIS